MCDSIYKMLENAIRRGRLWIFLNTARNNIRKYQKLHILNYISDISVLYIVFQDKNECLLNRRDKKETNK